MTQRHVSEERNPQQVYKSFDIKTQQYDHLVPKHLLFSLSERPTEITGIFCHINGR
jgi:hypothetical protein